MIVKYLISAIRTLKARYGSGFVLTMAPEHFLVQLGYRLPSRGRGAARIGGVSTCR